MDSWTLCTWIVLTQILICCIDGKNWQEQYVDTLCKRSGTKIGSWSRIIMVITGSERAALLHWRRREKVKNQAIFSPRFCTRKTCSGLFTLTRLEGNLSWIWFCVEHSGSKSRKRGFAQNNIIPNQKGVGESKLIWLATFRSSVTVMDKFS